MSIDNIKERIPEYAKDLKLNLSSVMMQPELSPRQLWGTAVSCAMATKNSFLIEEIIQEAQGHLTPQEIEAAKTAAAIMAMNNIYYRTLHLIEDEEYSKMPARLRMNGLRSHGTDPVDFELWCLAVSAINGCGKCLASHNRQLLEHGVERAVIQAALRVAAVVGAVGTV